MSPLHYLTVQDVLWINLQVTKKVHHFNYARLEEATAYQYAYGEKSSTSQAARFLTGFLKMHPFDVGNEATAFVACAAFLKITKRFSTSPISAAPAWFENAHARQASGVEALTSIVKKDPEHHEMDQAGHPRRDCPVIDAYPHTVVELIRARRRRITSLPQMARCKRPKLG